MWKPKLNKKPVKKKQQKSSPNHFKSIPGNTDNGWRIWSDRNGGGYGGSWDGSGPLEIDDGDEIIEGLPLAAITSERSAWKIYDICVLIK